MAPGRPSPHLPGRLGPSWEGILGGCQSLQAFLGISSLYSSPSQLWHLSASFCTHLLTCQVSIAEHFGVSYAKGCVISVLKQDSRGLGVKYIFAAHVQATLS